MNAGGKKRSVHQYNGRDKTRGGRTEGKLGSKCKRLKSAFEAIEQERKKFDMNPKTCYTETN